MADNRLTNALPVFLALLLVGGGAGLIALGRRSSPAPALVEVPAASPAPAPPTATAPRTGNDWQTILARWLEAMTHPAQSGAASTPSPAPPVVINVAAVAAHHPAWQLAAALERNPALPLRFEAMAVPEVEVAFSATSGLRVADSAANTPYSPSALPPPAQSPSAPDDIEAGASPEPATAVVAKTAALRDAAQEHQLAALAAFLQDAGARQQRLREESAAIGLTALEEEMEIARRLRLDAIVPPLPPDAVQLRMINLRLDLLQNVFSTAEERSAARQELEALQEQWHHHLQAQAQERAAQLAALQSEQDQREQQTRTKFAAALIAQNERDAQAREHIRETHRARVQTDFAAAASPLQIALPAIAPRAGSGDEAQTPRRGAARSSTTAARPGAASNFAADIAAANVSLANVSVKNLPVANAPVANELPGSPLAASAPQRAAVIHALRAQAWREARRWSRMAARRHGWNWSPRAASPDIIAADKTSTVIALLNSS